MTGLVVAVDADADFNDIVTYLRREAGARIARYSRRFNSHWNVCSNSHKAAPRGRCLVRT